MGKEMTSQIKETSKFLRRNITLPKSAVDRLTQLREHTEATSDSQVIRDALKIYAEIIAKEKIAEPTE